MIKDLIKMDFYRMKKSKMTYVMLIIMFGLTAMNCVINLIGRILGKDIDISMTNTYFDITYTKYEFLWKLGDAIKVHEPLDTTLVSSLRGMTIGMLIWIYCAVFCTSEFKSGFIKNIGGRAISKSNLLVSRVISLSLFTVAFNVMFVIIQTIQAAALSGYIAIVNFNDLAQNLLLCTLFYVVISMIIIMIAYTTKSTVSTVILSVLISSETSSLGTLALSAIVYLISGKTINFNDYTVTGNLVQVEQIVKDGAFIKPLIVVSAYFVIAFVLSMRSLNKKDLV